MVPFPALETMRQGAAQSIEAVLHVKSGRAAAGGGDVEPQPSSATSTVSWPPSRAGAPPPARPGRTSGCCAGDLVRDFEGWGDPEVLRLPPDWGPDTVAPQLGDQRLSGAQVGRGVRGRTVDVVTSLDHERGRRDAVRRVWSGLRPRHCQNRP